MNEGVAEPEIYKLVGGPFDGSTIRLAVVIFDCRLFGVLSRCATASIVRAFEFWANTLGDCNESEKPCAARHVYVRCLHGR